MLGEGNSCSGFLGDRQVSSPILRPKRVHLERGQLVAHQLDRFPSDAVLAQLSFDHALATWCVSIALLQPPPGERQVVDEAKCGEMLESGIDDLVARMSATQAPLDLPAAPRPRAEEPRGDL